MNGQNGNGGFNPNAFKKNTGAGTAAETRTAESTRHSGRLMQLGSRGGFTKTAGADGYIVGLVTKFKEIAKETSATIPGKTITVASVTRSQKPLAYPYILFMVRDEQTGAGVVSALLVEKGGDSGVSKKAGMMYQNVTKAGTDTMVSVIDTTLPDETITSMVKETLLSVAKEFAGQDITLGFIGLLPASVQADNNDALLESIARDTLMTAFAKLDTLLTGGSGVTIADIVVERQQSNSTVMNDVSFGMNTLQTSVGMYSGSATQTVGLKPKETNRRSWDEPVDDPFNAAGGNCPLTQSLLSVEFAPVVVQQRHNGGGTKDAIRFRPIVYVNAVDTMGNYTGLVHLAIAAATALMTVKGITNIVAAASDNIGVLNTYTEVGTSEVLDLKAGDQVANAAIIAEMLGGCGSYNETTPLLGMVIPNADPALEPMQIYAEAAKTADGRAALIEELVNMTGGTFPSDFNPASIFLEEAITIPTGVVNTKGSEIALHNMTLATVAAYSKNDEDIMATWISSETANDGDPFIDRLSVYAALFPAAELGGTATKVLLSPEFLAALVNALARADNFQWKFDDRNMIEIRQGRYSGGISRLGNVDGYKSDSSLNATFGNRGGFKRF